MITICIPVYNHSFLNLTTTLHQQCLDAKISFEIIVSDDCSPDEIVKQDAEAFQKLSHAHFHRNEHNLGNDMNRNQLTSLAKYPWLLFLDADTMPINQFFIANYVEVIKSSQADAYSGGIVYGELQNPNHILKWKHGKKNEEISTKINEDDFLGFRGSNFLIKKKVFEEAPFVRMVTNYGYIDTVFGINLKLNGYRVKLIHNPVEHLCLMDNDVFIAKTQKAIDNAIYLKDTHPEIADKIKIVRIFKKIKNIKANSLIANLFLRFKNVMCNQLNSSNPSLFLFQLYKLGYFCWAERQKSRELPKDIN